MIHGGFREDMTYMGRSYRMKFTAEETLELHGCGVGDDDHYDEDRGECCFGY